MSEKNKKPVIPKAAVTIRKIKKMKMKHETRKKDLFHLYFLRHSKLIYLN